MISACCESTYCHPEQKSRKKISLPKIRYNQNIFNACLDKSHGGPWTLDYDDTILSVGLSPMGIKEHAGFWEVFGKAPFSPFIDVHWMKPAAAITE